MNGKTCTKCKQSKELADFCKDKQKSDGLSCACKTCRSKTCSHWHAINKDTVNERHRRHYESMKDEVLLKMKESRDSNLDARRAAEKERYYAKREHIRSYQNIWRNENIKPEQRNAKQNAYLQANPGKRKEYKHRRRAREYNAEGCFTAQEWLDLCDRNGNLCVCCGKLKPLTADHIVPLSKGGTNYISNIQPLCKSCNSSKSVKSTRFIPQLGESL